MRRQTRFSKSMLSVALVSSSALMHAADQGPRPILESFLDRDGVVAYTGRGWSVRSGGTLGWVSMKVGEDEFLHSTERVGGFLYSDQDPGAEGAPPLFPDRSTISHDRLVGHLGLVANGIHMIRFTADPQADDNELYFGANSDADNLTCTLFLSSGVVRVEVDDDRVVTSATEGMLSTRRAVLVHANGSAVVITSRTPRDGQAAPPPFAVGMVVHPSGDAVKALVFDTPGFKANPYRIDFGSEPRTVNPVEKAMFHVISSDDPAGANRVSGNVATRGVINPEYGPETELEIGFTFDWKGALPFAGYAELEVVHACGGLHAYERLELDGRGPGPVAGTFDPRFHMPGVSDVWLRIVDSGDRMLWNDRYRMLYAREQFQPDIRVEADFGAFWEQTLAELRGFPLAPETVRVEQYRDVPDFEIYAVQFNGWEGNRYHAMLYVPREGERPLPAIVSAHPGTRGFGINRGRDGVFGSDIRQDKRFVTIVPLIRGHEIDAPGVPFNHPWWGPIEARDTYVARGWYTALVRAVDYLAGRPELVDMTRVVAAGGSQGGALAVVVTALDARIAACFADCPSNAQPHEIMRCYGSFGPSYGIVPAGVGPAEAERILSYYNPVNFAPMITVPTHVGSNIGDLTVHSMGPLAVYRNLTALDDDAKAFHAGYTHGHGSGAGLARARNETYDRITAAAPGD